jgi:predicted dehydrogenase
LSEQREELTRKEFLASAGRGAVGMGLGAAALSALNVLPVHAEPVARKPRLGPNDSVVLGLIGCGGMGAANMRALMGKAGVQVAALCDVDDNRMGGDIKDVTEKYGKKPDLYKDYRKMLERKDIDAVIVGTPDHWHALNLIHAVEAGKDAYCEKPIAHDITESKSMAAAVKHYGKIVQVGTWQRSTAEFFSAVEFVRAGKLGRVTTVRAWKTDPFQMGHHKPGAAPPSTFDYEMWTGPAPLRPYIPEYTHSNWRWFLENGDGMTGDWGVHMMDIGLLGMSRDTDMVMPTEAAAYGGKMAWPDDDRTWFDTHYAILKFSEPNFVLLWQTGRDHPNRPDHGTEFVSEDGRTLMVWRGGWKVSDPEGNELPKENAQVPNDHWQNWLDCLKSREQPRSNLASMAQTTIVCHLCNAALFAGETIRWDKAKMDLVGRAGRNTLSYGREYRKPWKLPIYKA